MAAKLHGLVKSVLFSSPFSCKRLLTEKTHSLIHSRAVLGYVICSRKASSETSRPTHSAQEDNDFSQTELEKILKAQHKDMPEANMTNPYQKPYKKCLICQYNVPLNYKNTKLLTQFVSPYTGQIYGAHVTGLCIPMQRKISLLINRARRFGFMPYLVKEITFLEDPKLFDPMKRS